MALNLDEIISSSNSVDDVVAALQNETAAQLKVREQARKIADAGQSALNPLEWLKGVIDPRSTSGIVANSDAYNKYYMDAVSKGEEPMSRKEFLDVMNKQQQQRQQQSNSRT